MGRPEDKYVKIPALIHATRIGYNYIPKEGKRAGIDYDIDTNIFYEPFCKGLEQINNRAISKEDAKHLITEIRQLLSADDLGREFFEKLQTGLNGYKLLDFDNPANNVFNVLTELPYANGEDNFRPDIIFLVNGMPLGFMEAKRQNNKDGIIAERERMFSRFHNPAFRRFVNITQLMAFSNNQEYDDEDRQPIQGSFYASSSYGKMAFNHFREEESEHMLSLVTDRNSAIEGEILQDNNLASYAGAAELETSIDPTTPANRIITSLFSPERFLLLIHYGICYVEKTDEGGIKHLQKHIMRYPQLFATKAVDRALTSGKRKGVIWHTQGSGKTALSFYLTRYLRDWYQGCGKVARFFFIVDRLDLATQAANEFRSRGAIVNMVASKDEFKQSLKPTEQSPVVADTDAPIVTVVNIQKFAEDSTAAKIDYSLNIQRIYFIDEAHRDYKNGGAFLSNLVTSDRESVKIALTGTPLVDSRHGNATKQVFGGYIHKYFYNQSIADGYTLKLLREDVRTEFRVKMQEVMRELQEVKKLVKLEDVFEHKNYVEPLADYIVNDYMHSQIALDDDSIGGMIVAYSSKQARTLYEYLSQIDQDISVELILHDEGTKESRKEITDNFRRDDSNIDILIVFNMLLTGFDAHRLKKLYLCRPIKAHNLLQALTRVNRPYKDMAHGYVVDFADITEEYDKTNRAYLAELTGELGDAASEYSSLFEDPKTVESDLAAIKNLLFEYTTSNVVEFQREISTISDKAKLYELRNALARYKDLRNVANMFGYEHLYEQFDVSKAQELLSEVSLRIQAINNKEALALKDMSTGSINLLLSQMEFSFRRIGEDELEIADEFQDKLRRMYSSFASNIDPSNPEYINLLDELRKRFEMMDIEEMTSTDMKESIQELDSLRSSIDELNRKNQLLAKKYDGDEKFVRMHKRVLRTPPPLTDSPIILFNVLHSLKEQLDSDVLANHNVLDNKSYFAKDASRMLSQACKAQGLSYKAAQIKELSDYIASEYINERGKAA